MTEPMALDAKAIEAAKALKRLMLAYVSLMETGRRRIIDLGGSCDTIEVMEAGDPALIEAKAALAALTPPAVGEGLEPVAWSEIKPWPLQGYAPGKYTCHCVSCGNQFEGDKRAVQCLECAVRSIKVATPAARAAVLEAAAKVADEYADTWAKIGARTAESNAPSVRVGAGREIAHAIRAIAPHQEGEEG